MLCTIYDILKLFNWKKCDVVPCTLHHKNASLPCVTSTFFNSLVNDGGSLVSGGVCFGFGLGGAAGGGRLTDGEMVNALFIKIGST